MKKNFVIKCEKPGCKPTYLSLYRGRYFMMDLQHADTFTKSEAEEKIEILKGWIPDATLTIDVKERAAA